MLKGMAANERLHWKIMHRYKEDVEADIDELVTPPRSARKQERAVWVLNKVLLPAMKEVGDKFGAGELILPSCCNPLK